MIIKFLPHGQGDPFRAAAYVMDDKDHLNIPRVGVEILEPIQNIFYAKGLKKAKLMN